MLARLSLRAIRGYQHYLSPHKGFSCAYRRATGRDGCSGYGYRVIERFGVRTGLSLLRRRLRLCGDTHRRRAAIPNPVLHYQRGECDCGLPCDTSCSMPCDTSGSNPCDCSCDPLERYLDRKYERAKRRWRIWRQRANGRAWRRTRERTPPRQPAPSPKMNEELAMLREREEIDLAYEYYLLKKDGSVITIPRLVYGTGLVSSGAGLLLAGLGGDWILGGLAAGFCGMGLTSLSYRLKRKAIGRSTVRPKRNPKT